MKYFKNLRTAAKILSLAAVLTILMLVIAVTGYRSSVNLAGKIDELYKSYTTPAIMMSEAKALALTNRRMVLSIMDAETEDEIRSYESRMMENRRKASEMMAKYEQTGLTADEKNLLKSLQDARTATARLQDEALVIIKKNGRTGELARRMLTGGDISNAENAYIAIFDKLVDFLIKKCEDTNSISLSDAKSAATRMGVISLAAVLIGLILGLTISNLITGPIKRIQDSIKLFSEGDLVSQFDVTGRDELASMGRGLQLMADSLKGIIGSVKTASSNINNTAQEFSSLAAETSASVEEFRANVDEMGNNLTSLASTGEEVNASVEEVAAGAQATAEKGTDIARQVDEAMGAGENGMNAVRQAVHGIEGVAKNAADTASSVQELGGRTRQIQSFVAQIGGIADQTNLLALNAAIEAARAGEAGRGFAVVAEEVRKLAEDSNVAAKNIEELARTITGDLDSVMQISLDNARASKEASELSHETERIISNMISYLRNISGATQDLAAVSEEQAASSEEIAEAVQNIATKVSVTAEAGENIRSGIDEVAKAAERISSGAEGLSNLAGELIKLLEFFRMEESPSSGVSRLRAIESGRRR
ncbi:MAG: methyl-accepting chemotaxis protein [Synergistaceae bacterium]|jgi:methyl-accepting chemotaxis protein|nr:methyl-accepting chemotaxis protein [Synergistaceae bacterium]